MPVYTFGARLSATIVVTGHNEEEEGFDDNDR